MSPRSHREPISDAAARALARLGSTIGQAVHDERVRRHQTLSQLADRAGVSPSHLQAVESGEPVSLETYARVTTALDLRPELVALDPRQRQRAGRERRCLGTFDDALRARPRYRDYADAAERLRR